MRSIIHPPQWKGLIEVVVQKKKWRWDTYAFWNPFAARRLMREVSNEQDTVRVSVYLRLPWQSEGKMISRHKGIHA